MMIGRIQPKIFHIGFKRHFISLKRRMVGLTNHVLSKIQHLFSGTVYLEGKARPSQDLSTSSDVSVRAEVEDHPLLGNRKLWPSQLFDPFETSSSDMEVDFPLCFKKTVDGAENIKPNAYHGFGEASIKMVLLFWMGLTTIVVLRTTTITWVTMTSIYLKIELLKYPLQTRKLTLLDSSRNQLTIGVMIINLAKNIIILVRRVSG